MRVKFNKILLIALVIIISNIGLIAVCLNFYNFDYYSGRRTNGGFGRRESRQDTRYIHPAQSRR